MNSRLDNTEFNKIVLKVAMENRNKLEKKYGTPLYGKCIESSDAIVEELRKYGIKAESKRVWVLYEYFENCTDLCYEEHWLTVIERGQNRVYVDVTMDQFQAQFYRILPRVYVRSVLPRWMLSRQPGKTTKLQECGWNDWYNTGRYVNNFRYWD